MELQKEQLRELLVSQIARKGAVNFSILTDAWCESHPEWFRADFQRFAMPLIEQIAEEQAYRSTTLREALKLRYGKYDKMENASSIKPNTKLFYSNFDSLMGYIRNSTEKQERIHIVLNPKRM